MDAKVHNECERHFLHALDAIKQYTGDFQVEVAPIGSYRFRKPSITMRWFTCSGTVQKPSYLCTYLMYSLP